MKTNTNTESTATNKSVASADSHCARIQSRVHTAVLSNPAKVEHNFRDHTEEARETVRGRWLLVGAVSEAMYLSLAEKEGEDICAALEIYPSPSGAKYAVLTSQVEDLQHRFVFPMYEPKAFELLTVAVTEPFSIYLESTGAVIKGIAYDFQLQPIHYELAAKAACQLLDASQETAFIDEFPLVVNSLASPETVRSLNSEIVWDVDVSLLLPEALSSKFRYAVN
jgi:hypothetical protein